LTRRVELAGNAGLSNFGLSLALVDDPHLNRRHQGSSWTRAGGPRARDIHADGAVPPRPRYNRCPACPHRAWGHAWGAGAKRLQRPRLLRPAEHHPAHGAERGRESDLAATTSLVDCVSQR
jgi:hypothetical protein